MNFRSLAAFAGWALALCAAATPLAVQAQIAPSAGSVSRDNVVPALPSLAPNAPTVLPASTDRPVLGPTAVRMTLAGVRFSGVTAFAPVELSALTQDLVGVEVGFAEFTEAAARVTRHYARHGYLLARAYLPAQDIADQILEIAVAEGRFGNVGAANQSSLRDSVVDAHLASLAGTVARQSIIERKLLLLNDLAGVDEAEGELQPGARPGETSLRVNISSAPRVSGGLEIDNHGVRFVGTGRVIGRLTIADPLGLGDAFSVRAVKGFDGLSQVRVSYEVPIGGDGLRVGAVHTTTRYELGKTFAPLLARGELDGFALGVGYPFVRSANFNLHGQLSMRWGDLEDRIDSTASVSNARTRAATLALVANSNDGFGGGGANAFRVAYTGGWLDIETPAELAADAAGPRANGGFGKLNFHARRLQALDARTALHLSFAAQKAFKNLNVYEKTWLGGASGVRAYPNGEAPGDSGYLASVELRHTLAPGPWPGQFQPFIFLDAGGVAVNERPFAAGANRRYLSAAGIGLVWSVSKDLQLKASLATRMGNQPATSDTDSRTRLWAQATIGF